MRGLIASAVAAVLCAGCAASGADRPFTPGGGDAPVSGATSAAPSSAPPRSETLSVGDDLKVVVEWPGGLDAEHTQMIETFRDAYTGMFEAVVTRGKDTRYLALMETQAGQSSYEWVKAYVDGRRGVRGTARLYGLMVSGEFETAAQVDVCVDESGLRLTDARTGRELPAARQPASYRPPKSTYLQSAAVHRGDDGTWRIKLFRHAALTNERAKGCRR
ncbi:hypothetical protein [Spongiactinospora sp. TRM90649]|uniref:hypothetical protein n=1 Tax=Spongiactinospora sp. TRM90649 TaxID=3031114 RepID=UPI0023F9533F|nr:hypothetical protein [Spongiactinospora sp. TRM90649]MDF5751260.1 hypothetical protein [Spongiactinospora sp. TRM90649]